MGCSQLPGPAFRASADLPDHALAVPWFDRPAHAPPVFAACRKIRGPSVQKENAPSARALCFDTTKLARLWQRAARPDSRSRRVVGSTSEDLFLKEEVLPATARNAASRSCGDTSKAASFLESQRRAELADDAVRDPVPVPPLDRVDG